MADVLNLFIDDGGVMNDNSLRAPQWQRYVGEFFAPRLGGEKEQWSEANRLHAEAVFHRAMERTYLDYLAFTRAYELDWLRTMCNAVGRPAPEDDDEAFALAREAAAFVISNVRSAFPGVVDAIREFSKAGCTLYTASGEPSHELAIYLEGMGVRELFTTLYGPDLVGYMKSFDGSRGDYYGGIFRHAGVDPSTCVVIDNGEGCLAEAKKAGARTVLLTDALDRAPAPDGFKPDLVLPRLADLPPYIAKGWFR